MPRHRLLRPRSVAAVVVVLVLALNLGALVALRAFFPGLTFGAPDRPSSSHASKHPVKVQPVVALSGRLPAQTVIQDVLAADPTTLPGPGWAPGQVSGGASGTPYDYTCGRPDGPAPVVSQVRGWAQTAGPLPDDVRGALSVSLRAFAAGQGAVAFDALHARLAGCSSASAGPAANLGTQAMSAVGSDTASLVWRRGDVIALVSYRVGGRAGPLAAIGPIATEYDALLSQALGGVCVDVGSTAADAARSPYVDRTGFRGRTVDRTVPAPALPDVSAKPDATPAPFPQPSLSFPTVAPLPPRPLDPVSPAQAPAPVATPVAPVAPNPAPTEAVVPERVADPDGPGCGWAFTGQAAPPFDQAKSAADLAAAQASAQRQLGVQEAQFETAKTAYQVAYQAYARQVQAFIAYAVQAEQTRQAWNAIQQVRNAYYRAVAVYNAAVAANARFPADQQAALQAYQAELATCAAPPPPPSPPPPPPAPGATPTPTPSTPPPPVCPPVRPAILDQQPPPVPAKPVPPPGLPR